ncbi:peroxisome proliferator-activated receptor gamma coactivator-related protein 1 [Latimeria chalumnae]|uniref:peroxisome proliferator-activated receptor gamma coactivator-related protein 1 n=1 Tax=Latimeria chalumnae TaxID=7897 RepID=UPI00313A7A51
MAARRGAGEELLAGSNPGPFGTHGLEQCDGLEEDVSCASLSDLSLSAFHVGELDTGEILGAFQGCIDQSIISIIGDSDALAENKSRLEEETEATLLTALTEILDNVDNENLSPFDAIPDSELLVSPKERENSLLKLRCVARSTPEREAVDHWGHRITGTAAKLEGLSADRAWAVFSDSAAAATPPRRQHRARNPRNLSKTRIRGISRLQRSDGEEEEVVSSPGQDSSSEAAGERDSFVVVKPLDGGAELGLSASIPCIINTENFTVSDLVKYMHPYCLPALTLCLDSEGGQVGEELLNGAVLLEVVSAENGSLEGPELVLETDQQGSVVAAPGALAQELAGSPLVSVRERNILLDSISAAHLVAQADTTESVGQRTDELASDDQFAMEASVSKPLEQQMETSAPGSKLVAEARSSKSLEQQTEDVTFGSQLEAETKGSESSRQQIQACSGDPAAKEVWVAEDARQMGKEGELEKSQGTKSCKLKRKSKGRQRKDETRELQNEGSKANAECDPKVQAETKPEGEAQEETVMQPSNQTQASQAKPEGSPSNPVLQDSDFLVKHLEQLKRETLAELRAARGIRARGRTASRMEKRSRTSSSVERKQSTDAPKLLEHAAETKKCVAGLEVGAVPAERTAPPANPKEEAAGPAWQEQQPKEETAPALPVPDAANLLSVQEHGSDSSSPVPSPEDCTVVDVGQSSPKEEALAETSEAKQMAKEPKPKLLSLEQYRQRLQQRKHATGNEQKKRSQKAKWPSVPEPAAGLMEIPCLPMPAAAGNAALAKAVPTGPAQGAQRPGWPSVPTHPVELPPLLLPGVNTDVSAAKPSQASASPSSHRPEQLSVPSQAVGLQNVTLRMPAVASVAKAPQGVPALAAQKLDWAGAPTAPVGYSSQMLPVAASGKKIPNFVPASSSTVAQMPTWPIAPITSVTPSHPLLHMNCLPTWTPLTGPVGPTSCLQPPTLPKPLMPPVAHGQRAVPLQNPAATLSPSAHVQKMNTACADVQVRNKLGPVYQMKNTSVLNIQPQATQGSSDPVGVAQKLCALEQTQGQKALAHSALEQMSKAPAQSGEELAPREPTGQAQKFPDKDTQDKMTPSSVTGLRTELVNLNEPKEPVVAAARVAGPANAALQNRLAGTVPKPKNELESGTARAQRIGSGSSTEKMVKLSLPAERPLPMERTPTQPSTSSTSTDKKGFSAQGKSSKKELGKFFTNEIGIEASDVTSLLEQFESSQAKDARRDTQRSDNAMAVGNSRLEVQSEKKLMERLLGPELANTAGLTPPATPPHQVSLTPISLLGKQKSPSSSTAQEKAKSSPAKTIKLIDPKPLPHSKLRAKNAVVLQASALPAAVGFGDHDYCLPSSLRGVSAAAAAADARLEAVPPHANAAEPEPASRWNIKHRQSITIKPIVSLSRGPQGGLCQKPPEAAERLQSEGGVGTQPPGANELAKNCTDPLDHRTNEIHDQTVSDGAGGGTVLLSPAVSPCRDGDAGTEESGSRPAWSFRCYRRTRRSRSPVESRRRGRRLRRATRSCSSNSDSSSLSSSNSESDSSSRSRSPPVKRRRRYRSRRKSGSSSCSSSCSSSSSRSWLSSRRRSYSRSRSRSWSRSRSQSTSPYRRGRQRYDDYDGYSSQDSYQRHRIREKEIAIEERRVVYIGKIHGGMTRAELKERFSYFGEIEECTIHFREQGDNYGFVTYRYTTDAFAAIENGHKLRRPDELPFDLCFGGRRQFCKTTYADLDSNRDDYDPTPAKSKFEALDFDTLLKQAQKNLRR